MWKKGVDVRTMAKDIRDLNRMAADSQVAGDRAAAAEAEADIWSGYLQKFSLYETTSKFYMIGRDKNRRIWRVLLIDRLEPCELNIHEDPTIYSEIECYDLLKRIHSGNRSTGGLKFVTKCYGIVGFVKFLGPYYMLLITRRRKIGSISGHVVYAVSKSEMIALPHPTVRSNMAYSKDENRSVTSYVPRQLPWNFEVVIKCSFDTRYKRLLCMVDLTKDFFFSYSYNIMRSLQKNVCDGKTEQVLYETMFVWNEFLTRGIRNHLKNTIWTVALVYGFFKQAKLSISGKDFRLTLIARRSRHFAGTRYLKRGINEKGRVANDVETEQIVFEDVPGEVPTQITSVVQNRGSIPLFWSQETSRLNIRPDIILQKKDQSYEATRLHFDNLVERYGNPIIILNLIKACEKKPRESLLRAEFAHVIDYINKDLSENFLRFLHWDLQKDYRRKGTDVLALLCNVAAYVLDLTGFFYCLVTPALTIQGASKWPIIAKDNDDDSPCNIYDSRAEGVVKCGNGSSEDKTGNPDISGRDSPADKSTRDGSYLGKQSIFQKGVLRTNCIDCLDRTNVAQYAYGLAALGHQLCSLGFIDVPRIDLEAPLADDLMFFYERMGDTLALQYGGSAAHNKIFSERRGQWKAATQSQELLRTLQRYYSNMYMDAEKQDAINVFLGHFQPQQGKPALWELDSDQHHNIGRRCHAFAGENARSFINRSQSDGIMLCESSTPLSSCSVEQKEPLNSALPPRMHKHANGKRLSDSMPQISTCESDMRYSRCTLVMSPRELSVDSGRGNFTEHRFDESIYSNFLDLDWLSSSGNLCEEETSKRANSSIENLSAGNVMNGVNTETSSTEEGPGIKGEEETNRTLTIDAAESSGISNEFTDSFVQWVANGGSFCY